MHAPRQYCQVRHQKNELYIIAYQLQHLYFFPGHGFSNTPLALPASGTYALHKLHSYKFRIGHRIH